MLKHTMLITSLALSSISSAAMAAETFYVGAQYNHLSVEDKTRNGDATETLGTVSLLGGYQFSTLWALELRQHFVVNEQTALPVLTGYQMNIDSQQSLLLKGTYPLNDQFSFYGLVGVSSTKFALTSLTNAPIPAGITSNNRNNGLAVGFGAEYQLSSALSATIEYIQHRDLLFQDGQSRNKLALSGIALGVNYRF